MLLLNSIFREEIVSIVIMNFHPQLESSKIPYDTLLRGNKFMRIFKHINLYIYFNITKTVRIVNVIFKDESLT